MHGHAWFLRATTHSQSSCSHACTNWRETRFSTKVITWSHIKLLSHMLIHNDIKSHILYRHSCFQNIQNQSPKIQIGENIFSTTEPRGYTRPWIIQQPHICIPTSISEFHINFIMTFLVDNFFFLPFFTVTDFTNWLIIYTNLSKCLSSKKAEQ